MMKIIPMVPILSAIFLAGISLGQPIPSDSLTLEQAIHLTLENQPVLQQAQYGVAASEARIGASRSFSYPEFSIAGFYTRIGPVATINLPDLGSFQLYPFDNYDFHLGLRQTLYDFGKTATTIRLAESMHRADGDNVDVIRYNLAYRTIAVFNTILILQQSIVVLDEQIDALDKHLELSTKKIQAGTATDFDTLTTRVRIAVAENERIDAMQMKETQEIILRQLTGLPEDQPVRLRGMFATDGLTLNPDSLLVIAKDQRHELLLSKDAEASAAVQVRLASCGDKPSLALSLSSGLKNGYVPNLGTLKGNFTAGLQVHVPLFNGHRARYQEEEADANLRAAQAHTADIRRQIVSEVEQAIAGVNSSRQKIAGSETQVRQAEAALAMARARYDAGVITNLDLLDAQTALSQVRLIRLRAFFDYTVSLNALDKATGKRMW